MLYRVALVGLPKGEGGRVKHVCISGAAAVMIEGVIDHDDRTVLPQRNRPTKVSALKLYYCCAKSCAWRSIGPLFACRFIRKGKAVPMRRCANRAIAIAAGRQKALQARILVGSALLLSAALLLLLISP